MEDIDKKIEFLKEYKTLCEKHQLHIAWDFDNIIVSEVKGAYPSLYEAILLPLNVSRYDLEKKLNKDDWDLTEEDFKDFLESMLC